MTRRTATQALIAVIAGAMDPKQKTTPKQTQTGTPRTDPPILTTYLPLSAGPLSLTIYLNWKTVTIHRGDETVTLDQDELFSALKEVKQP